MCRIMALLLLLGGSPVPVAAVPIDVARLALPGCMHAVRRWRHSYLCVDIANLERPQASQAVPLLHAIERASPRASAASRSLLEYAG